MKRLRYVFFALLIAVALMTGDWLASPHTWWVFDVPAHGKEKPKATGSFGNPEVPMVPALPIASTVANPRMNAGAQPSAGVAAKEQTSAAPISGALEGGRNVTVQLGAGPIAVIHSRRMLQFKDGKPLPGELERLRAAMIAVSERWDHPILIFDADGATLNTIPVVLYEDDKHDVTSIVLEEMNRDVVVTR